MNLHILPIWARASAILVIASFALHEIPADADASEGDLSGRVIRIVDGDTVEALIGRDVIRIRLAEIDAPESDQPWGRQSTEALSELVRGKVVTLRVTDHDRYGRAVAQIEIGEIDVNRHMIREGHAWAFRKYLEDQSLLEVEASARKARRGLWSQDDPVPPWEWRAGEREGLVQDEAKSAAECGSKRVCREMVSCEEAYYFLEVCGLSRLDGDGDGIPCEAICD